MSTRMSPVHALIACLCVLCAFLSTLSSGLSVITVDLWIQKEEAEDRAVVAEDWEFIQGTRATVLLTQVEEQASFIEQLSEILATERDQRQKDRRLPARTSHRVIAITTSPAPPPAPEAAPPPPAPTPPPVNWREESLAGWTEIAKPYVRCNEERLVTELGAQLDTVDPALLSHTAFAHGRCADYGKAAGCTDVVICKQKFSIDTVGSLRESTEAP